MTWRLFLLGLVVLTEWCRAVPATVSVTSASPQSYAVLKTSNQSVLYGLTLPDNVTYRETQPFVTKLKGTRFQIGYDYASLLASETSYTLSTFMNSTTSNATVQRSFLTFATYLWDHYYVKYIPAGFLEELRGMDAWYQDAVSSGTLPSDVEHAPSNVTRWFNVLANMPADPQNIISAMEDEIEHGWPKWLKDIVNEIISVLENLGHHCDAYGVWGSRTVGGRLYTSRNLDYNSNTGINKYKNVIVYEIQDPVLVIPPYASIGFTFGLGALAGINMAGITTSEMNLDNSRTTFSGVPFPMRLRYVLEGATNLETAMTLWNHTNNTNSFNFLIGSASDGAAFALETMRRFTGVFPANSPIEAAATYDCGVPPDVDTSCAQWTNETGNVSIGFPLPEAVWRSNHGMNPVIMKTQEPLFNDTVFRYNLMHNLFVDYAADDILIGDAEALRIVATVGTKGSNFLTCAPQQGGSNVLSVVYVPGEHRFYAAWENGSGQNWSPAACSGYIHFDLTYFL
eukprot:CAMPEP_0176408802 /NCGR_PEP_ID=MMETSP0127-20121128/2155_1 /TAXON_ID=938130 /ORGANISM="Platyophrya macrostoma, Strain WH" /LENGTH=511 /DNA_ID=CAMNT_0017788131 /DNA_START=3 /DNA_END=1538 /DNA_ORIENTATION=+